jgi:hypothetical protein
MAEVLDWEKATGFAVFRGKKEGGGQATGASWVLCP